MSIVSMSIVDDAGARKAVETFLPDGLTLVQYQGFLTGFAPLVDAIIGGKIVGATISLPLTLPSGLKASAVATSTVRRGGLFGYDNPSPYKWSQYVPSVTPSLFVGELVNVGDTDVGAYITAMESGITVSGTPITPTNQYGDDLTTNVSATEVFRK